MMLGKGKRAGVQCNLTIADFVPWCFCRKVLDLKGDVCVCACARVRAHLRNVVFWRWTETRICYFEWEFDKNPNLDIGRLN